MLLLEEFESFDCCYIESENGSPFGYKFADVNTFTDVNE